MTAGIGFDLVKVGITVGLVWLAAHWLYDRGYEARDLAYQAEITRRNRDIDRLNKDLAAERQVSEKFRQGLADEAMRLLGQNAAAAPLQTSGKGICEPLPGRVLDDLNKIGG